MPTRFDAGRGSGGRRGVGQHAGGSPGQPPRRSWASGRARAREWLSASADDISHVEIDQTTPDILRQRDSVLGHADPAGQAFRHKRIEPEEAVGARQLSRRIRHASLVLKHEKPLRREAQRPSRPAAGRRSPGRRRPPIPRPSPVPAGPGGATAPNATARPGRVPVRAGVPRVRLGQAGRVPRPCGCSRASTRRPRRPGVEGTSRDTAPCRQGRTLALQSDRNNDVLCAGQAARHLRVGRDQFMPPGRAGLLDSDADEFRWPGNLSGLERRRGEIEALPPTVRSGHARWRTANRADGGSFEKICAPVFRSLVVMFEAGLLAATPPAFLQVGERCANKRRHSP